MEEARPLASDLDQAPVSPEREEREGRAPKNRTLAEMIGDTLREGALLVAVFGWLDRVVQQEPFWGPWAWTVLGTSAVLFGLGVLIERHRSGD